VRGRNSAGWDVGSEVWALEILATVWRDSHASSVGLLAEFRTGFYRNSFSSIGVRANFELLFVAKIFSGCP